MAAFTAAMSIVSSDGTTSIGHLAPPVVRYADDGAFLESRQAGDGGFDLRRVDVQAAGDEHVPGPVDDLEVPVFVQQADVTGVQPAL